MTEQDQSSASFRGLALSGGGFRASFFHIGVLARMAELDLLRGIEWISTVSGGSIIGALYYLKVKECLEESYRRGRIADAADYVQIVRELSDEFLAGTQQDIRSRAFGRWWATFSGETSHVIGTLYDKFFYARYAREGKSHVTMRDLRIDPRAVALAETSHAKAPKLCINATVLDTGQQWVFTPEDMGTIDTGPMGSKLSKILGRRHKYEDLGDDEYKDLSLGFAVASSACVPLVFPPVWLRLRPFVPELESMVSEIAAEKRAKQEVAQRVLKDVGFELVDGGVVDNLGLVALASKMGANGHVLVSNASAPSNAAVAGRPRSGLAVGRTSLTILMSKTQQAADLQALAQLQVEGDRDRKVEVSLAAAAMDAEAWAENDVQKIQGIVELIQGVRTDLDAFSTWEAHALMYAGYVSAGQSLPGKPALTDTKWPFQGAKAGLTLKSAQKHLSTSRSPFKLVRLTPYVVQKHRLGLAVLVVTLVSFLILRQTDPSQPLFSTAANSMWMVLSLLTFAALLLGLGFRLLIASVMTVTCRLSLALRPLLLRSRVPWVPR